MFYTKKLAKVFLAALTAVLCIICLAPSYAYAAPTDGLYLGGFPAGFVLNTTTVEVVGLCEVMTEDGMTCPARNSGIKAGDVIKKINDKDIKSSSDLTLAIADDYKQYTVIFESEGETKTAKISPAIDKSSGKKRLGLLVKDSVNGIGTVTYVDAKSRKFGSLGHPVTAQDGALIEINGGSIYGCAVYDVKRGLRGNPGELKGAFDNFNMIGKASKNCNCGIFGEISSDFNFGKLQRIEKADIGEVTMGKAEIYSTLHGDKAEKYEISIVKIDANNKDNRNFVIKIDDKALLDLSGGIVQGMSGSPIVQNGKLVGAVTHVFVNDPTRGYGIAIDKMMNSY